MQILVINCGSSSLKYQLIDLHTGEKRLAGKFEELTDAKNEGQTHATALAELVKITAAQRVDAVGHRVVHGGERFIEAVLVTDDVLAEIKARSIDAPLHNPFNHLGITTAQAQWPDVPHVAVFDTAFHVRMPARAVHYAIDTDVAEKHRIRRFGFHGTSHQYVAELAAKTLQNPIDELRIVTLHLGNGASACAVEFGKSTETSMGMWMSYSIGAVDWLDYRVSAMICVR